MQLGIIYKAEMSKDQSRVFNLDSGNLLPVAMKIRELSPDSEVIIAGDNDPPTKEYRGHWQNQGAWAANKE